MWISATVFFFRKDPHNGKHKHPDPLVKMADSDAMTQSDEAGGNRRGVREKEAGRNDENIIARA